jgi:hypothetical protein
LRLRQRDVIDVCRATYTETTPRGVLSSHRFAKMAGKRMRGGG